MSTRRVLFFSETVTLAHLARPVALARALDRSRFTPIIAAGAAYRQLVAGEKVPFRDLTTTSPETFAAALSHGRRLYTFETLRAYVEEDLQHIDAVQPDIVVGDFRLSLSVSARVAKVPYVALCNAYWSPYAEPRWEIPSHPAARVLGAEIAGAAFRLVRPLVFGYHSLPMHRLRRTYGLPSLGLDLRRVYTDGDWTLYADVPELVPLPRLPKNTQHAYIGAIPWSPRVELPSWWDSLPRDRPLVYVTMGSSGRGAALRWVVEALEPLPCVAVVAAAGTLFGRAVPGNVHVAEYLPGDVVAGRSRLVICNGGSPTTHQALATGVPVLGLAGEPRPTPQHGLRRSLWRRSKPPR